MLPLSLSSSVCTLEENIKLERKLGKMLQLGINFDMHAFAASVRGPSKESSKPGEDGTILPHFGFLQGPCKISSTTPPVNTFSFDTAGECLISFLFGY